jgi:asparagine synthase (glutamine-hydrolysing)
MTSTAEASRPGGAAPSLLPIPFDGSCERATAAIAIAAGDVSGRARARAAARAAQDDTGGALVFGWVRTVDAAGTPGRELEAADLRALWHERGDAVLDGITGEFLIALWDRPRARALLAVDRFATYPLYWCEHGDRVGFSARPQEAAARAGAPIECDWQALFAYAYFHMIPAPLCIYHGVQRLDLGEALRIERGRVEVVRYWTPRFDETRPFDFAAERDAFLEALRVGVAESTQGLGQDQVGCFLSGGTDSSTIAGLVGRQYGAPARTFSIGFAESGYDESGFSRLAARHFGTSHTEYFVTANDVRDAIAVVATQFEQPFGNSSALPAYFCAKLAAEAGVSRMLGGDGGDELYGGNERYAKQQVFAMYRHLPHPLRERLLEPMLRGPLAGAGGVVAKARSYVEQAREPLPDRLQSRYNLLNRLGASRVFTAAMLARVDGDAPLALEREVWSRATGVDGVLGQINRLLAWDFKFTLADSDLPKVTRACLAAGVEVSFPMLADGLLRHSLQLRPDRKVKGRRLRYFFKESLRGFLPDEIIAKQKHGFGLPFGAWLLQRDDLRATAGDCLGSLAARGVLARDFGRQIIAELESGHAGYYGTMIWVLTMLELWLRASPLADARVEAA